MRREDLIQLAFGLQDFAGRDLDVRGLPLRPAQRLMDHHPRVRQRRTLALGARREQHGAHRSREARADGRHVGADQLHRVVDAQPGRDGPAGRVDIDLDVLLRIDRLEEQQLRLNDIGRIVVDRGAEEDDAVHHQTREDVHRGDVELPLLDDRRRDVCGARRAEIVQPERADAAVQPGVFFKFGSYVNFVFSQKKDFANFKPAKSKDRYFFAEFRAFLRMQSSFRRFIAVFPARKEGGNRPVAGYPPESTAPAACFRPRERPAAPC